MKGPFDISSETQRQYTWICPSSRMQCTHTIYNPKVLYIGKTMHRVVDVNGLVHLVPCVGQLGCVVTWRPVDINKPVIF